MQKKHYINENFQHDLFLLEHRYVIKWFNQSNPEENEFYYLCNEIYNYFRHQAIEKINNYKINGRVDNINFDVIIPDELLKKPDGTKLTPLTIRYVSKKKLANALMYTYRKDDRIILEIYVDFFEMNFKHLFFHELRHVIQFSAGNIAVIDFFNFANVVYSQPQLNFLGVLLDYIKPVERNAYPEQIYNEAFTRFLNGEDSKQVIKSILEKYIKSDQDWNNVLQDIIYNSETYSNYICSLFLININDLVSKRDAKLFDKELYANPIVLQLRKEISSTCNKDELNRKIANATHVLKEYVLFKPILESYCRRMSYYRKQFKSICIDVISQAIQDADNTKQHSTLQDNLSNLYSYLRQNKQDFILEAVVEQQDKELIVELGAEFPTELYEKFNMLRNTVSKDLTVRPGFKVLNITLDMDRYVLITPNFEKLNNINDIPELVEKINKL